MLKALIVIFIILPKLATAQVNVQENNSYSQFGAGRLVPFGTVRNLGMGETGLAMPSSQYLNFKNPALLSRTPFIQYKVQKGETVSTIAKTFTVSEEEIRAFNKLPNEVKEGQIIKIPVRKYVMWEVAARGGYASFETPDEKFDNTIIGFQYFTLAIPVSQRYTAAVGLIPYSTVGFSSSYIDTLATGENVQHVNKHDGGLNQFFLSNGFDVNRNFSFGLQAGFLFGHIDESNSLSVEDVDGVFADKIVRKTANSLTALLLKPGIFYKAKINRAKGDSAVYLNIGVTADYITNGYLRQKTDDQTLAIYNAIMSDTSIHENKGSLNFPFSYSVGISISATNNFNIGVDFAYTPWNRFSAFTGTTDYTESYKISLGGEYKAKGRNSSLKTSTFRGGIAFQQLPYKVEGKTVNDYSLSLGTSLPVGRINMVDKNQPLTKVNLALVGGMQGDKTLSTGQGIYFKLYAGILISDRWFKRRKID